MFLNEWLKLERGRAAGLAACLGIPASLVSKMGAGKKKVPLDHCPYIEDFTQGAVTCEELRPDRADYFSRLQTRRGPSAVGVLECSGEGAHA